MRCTYCTRIQFSIQCVSRYSHLLVSSHLSLSHRTYILKACNCSESDLWYNAIRHTQVSGIPLQNQVTTSGGVPMIVHKCVQFVEAHGMDMEGVYRHSGQKAKIQRLTLEFNQGE